MRAPVRCLVLQLGGRAELVRSLLALKAAKQLHPELEITLACREQAAELAEQVDWIEEVAALPISAWALPIREGTATAEELLPEAAKRIARLVGGTPWDILANWTFEESASHLAALIPANHRLGYTRRPDLDFSSGDGWSQFIHAFVQQGVPQNIHLIDILTTQLLTALQVRHGDPLEAGNQAATGRDFFTSLRTAGDRILDPDRTWIGIQLNGIWNARQWARLAGLMAERHPEIRLVFLGTESERALADDVLKASPATIGRERLLNLVGETGLDLWIDCITQCSWIVSHRPLPAMMASILGTRSLQLAEDCSPDFTTAAYGNGHLLLHATDASVPLVPEAAYAAWSHAHFAWSHRGNRSFEEHLGALGFENLTGWIDLLVARIRPADEGGGVVYESEFERPLTAQRWLAGVNGQIARLWHCGWNAPEGAEINRSSIRPALLQELRALDESSSVLLRVSREAAKSSRELHQRATQLKSSKIMSVEERSAIETLGRRVLELQKLVERLARADAHLAGFATHLRVMMHNLEGDGIAEVSRDAAHAWQQVERGAELMRSWLKQTLRLARPVAVAPEPFLPAP